MKASIFRDLGGITLRSFKAWREDNAQSMAAALAFFTLFSLAPLLLVALAAAGFFFDRSQAQNVLIEQLAQLVGEHPARGIEAMLQAASDQSAARKSAAVGLITLFLGATTVFAELRNDLNRIWRVPKVAANGAWMFVRTRVLSFGLVMSIGFLLLVSLVVSAVLSVVGDMMMPGSAFMARATEFVTSLGVLTILFAMIYKFLPELRIAWRDVWIGAAFTSLLFWIGKFAIGLYIAKSSVASGFGAAGTVVVIVAWVYYSSLIFFYGAEFTRQYALLHAPDTPDADGRVVAANDEHDLVDRAKAIVSGKDPLVSGKELKP